MYADERTPDTVFYATFLTVEPENGRFLLTFFPGVIMLKAVLQDDTVTWSGRILIWKIRKHLELLFCAGEKSLA